MAEAEAEAGTLASCNLPTKRMADRPPRRPPALSLERVVGVTTRSNAALAASPTGEVAYAAGCFVVLLDPRRDAARPARFLRCAAPVACVAFSGDGSLVAAGTRAAAARVHVWRVSRGRAAAVADVAAHAAGVAAIAFTPDTRHVLSAGVRADGALHAWALVGRRAASGGATRVATGTLAQPVFALAVTPDGSGAVTAGARHLKFWDLTVLVRDGGAPRSAGAAPDSADAAAARDGVPPQCARLASLPAVLTRGGAEFQTFVGAAFVPASGPPALLALTTAGYVCAFDGATRRLERWVRAECGGRAYALDVSTLVRGAVAAGAACSAVALVAGGDGVVCALDAATLEQVGALRPPPRRGDGPADPAPPAAIAVRASPAADGGAAVAVVHADGGLALWRMPSPLDGAAPLRERLCLSPGTRVTGAVLVPRSDAASALPSGGLVLAAGDGARLWALRPSAWGRRGRGVAGAGAAANGVDLVPDANPGPPPALPRIVISADARQVVLADGRGRARVFATPGVACAGAPPVIVLTATAEAPRGGATADACYGGVTAWVDASSRTRVPPLGAAVTPRGAPMAGSDTETERSARGAVSDALVRTPCRLASGGDVVGVAHVFALDGAPTGSAHGIVVRHAAALALHAAPLTTACLARDGCTLVTAAADATLTFTRLAARDVGVPDDDATSVACVTTAVVGRGAPASARSLSPDSVAPRAAGPGAAPIVATSVRAGPAPGGVRVVDAVAEPLGRHVVTAAADGAVCVWSLRSGRMLRAVCPPTPSTAAASPSWDGGGVPARIALDPSGLLLAIGYGDGGCRLVDYFTGDVLARFRGHASAVVAVCFAPDCTRIATASADGCAAVWRLSAAMARAARQRLRELAPAPRGAAADALPSAPAPVAPTGCGGVHDATAPAPHADATDSVRGPDAQVSCAEPAATAAGGVRSAALESASGAALDYSDVTPASLRPRGDGDESVAEGPPVEFGACSAAAPPMLEPPDCPTSAAPAAPQLPSASLPTAAVPDGRGGDDCASTCSTDTEAAVAAAGDSIVDDAPARTVDEALVGEGSASCDAAVLRREASPPAALPDAVRTPSPAAGAVAAPTAPALPDAGAVDACVASWEASLRALLSLHAALASDDLADTLARREQRQRLDATLRTAAGALAGVLLPTDGDVTACVGSELAGTSRPPVPLAATTAPASSAGGGTWPDADAAVDAVDADGGFVASAAPAPASADIDEDAVAPTAALVAGAHDWSTTAAARELVTACGHGGSLTQEHARADACFTTERYLDGSDGDAGEGVCAAGADSPPWPSPATASLVGSWRQGVWGWHGLPLPVDVDGPGPALPPGAHQTARSSSRQGDCDADGPGDVDAFATGGAVLTADDVWLDDGAKPAAVPPAAPVLASSDAATAPAFAGDSESVSGAPESVSDTPDSESEPAANRLWLTESPGATLMAALAWGLTC